jgi:excisionase family DNA binding protein
VFNVSEVQPLQVASVSPLLCSVQQAAEALDIAPYTMRELCKAGAVQAGKFGGRWLVSVADLERYAAELTGRQSA